MTNELKQICLEKVSELLDKPITDAKIQIDYHYNEVPTIRYDITERILPNIDGLCKGEQE